jgi:DNA-binding transcriptional regulator YbjK
VNADSQCANAMRARKIRTEVRREQIAKAALGVVQRHGLRGLKR